MRKLSGPWILLSLFFISSLLFAGPVKNIRILTTTNVSGETDPCG